MALEMIIAKAIGSRRYSFVVKGGNLHDVVMEAEKLSFPDVYKCGLCDSENLRLAAYETKDDGYKYVKIICGKCRGSLTFGQQKKSPDTFYVRKREDGRFDWQAGEQKRQKAAAEGTELEPF